MEFVEFIAIGVAEEEEGEEEELWEDDEICKDAEIGIFGAPKLDSGICFGLSLIVFVLELDCSSSWAVFWPAVTF